VVDDEPAVCEWLQRTVSRADYECVSVPDGRAALEFLARLSHPPALIVTDIRMPGMSGIELGRRLRELHPNVPVLYMAADENDLPSRNAHWLLKPFSQAQLLARMSSVLADAEGGSRG
jgi:DNA-binding response OmpR family regulator